jgi:TetR/AcrR family transcriptional regulator, regulator of cefoperazone and chloramphenicol sensitivity
MPNVKNNVAAQETCRKLINAAGEVFAERGLHAATIKQITDRAGVNTAAINYHFSDKFELYAAVIRYALSITPVARSAGRSAGSPDDRLRAFIADVIDDLYDPSRPAWRSTLLAQEFSQPTAAIDAVMDELLRPQENFVATIVRDILGPGASEEQVLRATMSVASQCFFFVYQSTIIKRLHPQLLRDKHELLTHISEFCLAALHAMRRRLRPRQCRR